MIDDLWYVPDATVEWFSNSQPYKQDRSRKKKEEKKVCLDSDSVSQWSLTRLRDDLQGHDSVNDRESCDNVIC